MKYKGLFERHHLILDYLKNGYWHNSGELFVKLKKIASEATLKRDFSILTHREFIEKKGAGRATQYRVRIKALLLLPIDQFQYFNKPQDQRSLNIRFNFNIFEQLKGIELFETKEKQILGKSVSQYNKNIKEFSPALLRREFERVTIDLSWKSSEIEGNTYSLLETESLIKDGITAPGKTKEETTMLLNHKKAIEFIRANSTEFKILTIAKIEHLHSILSFELGISKNIRKRTVGISGTNYRPLENEFQIREALEKFCSLINNCSHPFAKALLAVLLISYIQPFEDGNKRTARLLGNALLLSYDCFPLSFRSVDATEYKMALLIFYEINNLTSFKSLFLTQANFAAKEYFR
jgi:Fic family protein